MTARTNVPASTDTRPWLCPREGCPAPTHDCRNGYRYGCRSGLALAEDRRYKLHLKAGIAQPRLVSKVGAVRRLQALSVAGWPTYEVARRLGRSTRTVERWRRNQNPKLTTRVFAEIVALYEELSVVPGPDDAARRTGRRFGWPGPDEWGPGEIDDPTADPRAADGVVSALTLDQHAVEDAVSGHLALGRLGHREQNEAVRIVLTRTDRYSTVFEQRVQEACRLLTCTPEELHPVVERVRTQARRDADRLRRGRPVAAQDGEVA